MRNSLQPQTQKKQTLEEIYPPKNPTPGNPLIFIATALIFLIFSALALWSFKKIGELAFIFFARIFGL